MCGIAGAINWANNRELLKMVQIQKHRGPDDHGVWHTRLDDGNQVGLGSTRLAIQDLSPAGHMPMTNSARTLWLVYNGEIYNFPELRTELLAKGYSLRSSTDTEVILHLYEEEGPNCVHRLNGMFAIAIWDQRKKELFLARDHFGVKPLYYVQQGVRFAFASEIKALLQLPGLLRRIDFESLHQYLTFLWVPEPRTMFEGIFKLPPGHYAFFREGKLKLVEYWDLTFPPATHNYLLSTDKLVEEIRERFRLSVRRQMISDVPVGAFLSGGIDSSSIVRIMSDFHPEPVRTYTISFPELHRRGEVHLDDPQIAQEAANYCQTNHSNIIVQPDVAALLPKIVWHLDEPIADPAAITAYLVCEAARPSTTVLLSGMGGDEVFAGYRKHIAHYLALLYKRIPFAARSYLIEPIISALPSLRGTPLKGYVRLAKKMARGGSLNEQDRFLMDSTYLDARQKSDLYSHDLRAELTSLDEWRQHRHYFGRVSDADFLNQMLYLDTKAFLTSLNLNYTDKMSMACSVEVRVPFLDKELVEFVAWQVPPSLKVNGRNTKHILRTAMAENVPESVLSAPKAGFGAPVDYWLANDLRSMVDDLLSRDTILRRGYFNSDFVTKLVWEQRSGRQDWSLQMWALISLELWLQTFVDKVPRV